MSTSNEQDAKRVEQARTTGEKERDNDAQRPDGSTGTEQDTTAQKTARDVPAHKPYTNVSQLCYIAPCLRQPMLLTRAWALTLAMDSF